MRTRLLSLTTAAARLASAGLLALAGILVLSGPALAQEGTIRGVVTGEAGQPLRDIAVQILGTDIGVFTDEGGGYVLQVPAGTHQLRAAAIGYQPATRTVTVAAGEDVTLDLRLATRAVELGEVVVSLAASEARRAQIGTDLERFDAAQAVDRGAVQSLSQLLNARASGLSVQQAAGSAGAASTIRIRGSTSITQDNNPIIYVDGVRVSNATGTGPGSFDFGNGQTISRLDDINPNDIQSVQVMKGPTAAALYGSEAAAGVILIETKRGERDRHRFTLNVEQGLTYDYYDYWDNFFNLTALGGVTDPNDPQFQGWNPIQNTVTGDVFARHNPLKNPLTDPFRVAHMQNYDLNVRGGIEDVNYFGSARYIHEDGTFQNNFAERYSFRANFDARPHERVNLSVSSGFTGADVRLPDNDRSAVGMITNAGAGLPMTSFGTNPDGSQGECLVTLLFGAPETQCERQQGNLTANFDKLATIENVQQVGRFMGSVTSNWRPFDWLSTRTTAGLDFIQTQNRNLVPLDPDRPFGANSDGFVDDRRFTDRTISLDAAGTADFQLSPHVSSSTTLGVQYFAEISELVSCTGSGGFASRTAIACDAALTFTGGSDRVENKEAGGFIQQRFGLDNYLFMTGAVRMDDNSAFGDNQDAIFSPSFNVSAVLSETDFWSVDWVDDFRVRLAWGRAAQSPAPFAHMRTFRPVRVVLDGSPQTGLSLLSPGNPDLTAERNRELEIGFDGAALDDRVGFKFTFYDQVTRDAIIATSVAPSTGFSGTRFVNIGEITNHGIEAQLGGTPVRREGLTWEVDFKLSTQSPRVTDLGDNEPILFGLGASHLMFREGFSPGAYYGVIVQSAERDGNGDIVPGSVQFMPGNVGPDGGSDPNNPNHRFLGHQAPTNEQSLSTTLTLGDRLRIFTLFDRAAGHHKYNQSNAFRSPFIPNVTGSREFALRHAEMTPEQQAAMEMGDAIRTALFIEKANYVKWRELTLRYDLPPRYFQTVGFLETAALTVGGRNLATMTGYSGLDPELRFDGGRDTFNASEFFSQPPGRSFFARLTVTF